MRDRQKSLAEYIDASIAKYRRGLPFALAALTSFAFGGLIAIFEIRADHRLISSMAPHISTLVETLDQPELQRLISSLAKREGREISIVQHGSVLATSAELSRINQPYAPSLSWKGFRTQVPIIRPNGPKNLGADIVVTTPIRTVLVGSIAAALLALVLGLWASSVLGKNLRHAINQSVRPIQNFDFAIRSLKALNARATIEPTQIQELEGIRLAILETHQELSNTRDALAEARAKELATDAYKRLIHDLHNPIAALKTTVKISESTDVTESERQEARARIPRIAEQVLSQITVARSHLEIESTLFQDTDIRECVEEATEQARLASGRLHSVVVERSNPDQPVIFPHDPRLLGRAVGNLVKNAMDACKEKVRVAIRPTDLGVQIQVMDDGPGISQENAGLYLQGRLKSTKGDRQAYGLAAASHIARSHGGRIVYRTSELGGACLEIRI